MRRILRLCAPLMLSLALCLPGNATAWGGVSTILTFEPVSTTYGDGVNVVAFLRDADTDAGIAGKVINFLVAGQFRSAVTDGQGRAVLQGLNPGRLNAGIHTGAIQARFDGRTGYEASVGITDLTVNKRPLRVIPQPVSREYGDPNPGTLPYRLENFAWNDNVSALTTAPACATEATQSSRVGVYTIACAGLEAANYEAAYETAAFKVVPAPMTVRADNQVRKYSDPNPAFTATYVGTWKLGEGPGVLDGALKCAAVGEGGSKWAKQGTYQITCAGQQATNYTLTYQPGKLTVTP